jgi:hypothetical protein
MKPFRGGRGTRHNHPRPRELKTPEMYGFTTLFNKLPVVGGSIGSGSNASRGAPYASKVKLYPEHSLL